MVTKMYFEDFEWNWSTRRFIRVVFPIATRDATSIRNSLHETLHENVQLSKEGSTLKSLMIFLGGIKCLSSVDHQVHCFTKKNYQVKFFIVRHYSTFFERFIQIVSWIGVNLYVLGPSQLKKKNIKKYIYT